MHARDLQCKCLDPKAKCPLNMINPLSCKCGTEQTVTDAGYKKTQCKQCKHGSKQSSDTAAILEASPAAGTWEGPSSAGTRPAENLHKRTTREKLERFRS